MLRQGKFIADRYEIIEQIGTGGMSDVYKAKCHKLNRYVAVKILKPEYSEDKSFVTKFRAEAQSAAGLIHPNIVNVYDVGDEDGIYYIVMELVEGITLKKYISKRGKIPYKEAVSIALQVAKGMEAAHSHKIIHRDIKPQNIIISKDGKVKVTDFGIAKVASSSTINSSSAMGSVHYISPEQARGGYSDERSDIYSFGISLFEMLTGSVPFDGETTVSVAVKHIQDEIPAPSAYAQGVPVSIDKIVAKCTQKKTERRYQSVSELIVDLKKSLVMPDQDFVVMAPVYGSPRNEVYKDSDNVNTLEEHAGKLSDDYIDDSLLEVDGYELESPVFDEEALNDEFDESLVSELDDDYRDSDEDNEKMEKTVKYIGIGIIALILLITVIILIKLIGGSNTTKNNPPTGSSQSVQQQSTAAVTDKITVPYLQGKTEEEARTELKALGLGAKVVKQASDTIEEGIVINQETKAGEKVNKNTTIIIVVSSGAGEVKIPEVTGLNSTEAQSLLKTAGFDVYTEMEASSEVEKGKVIRVTPSAGTAVAKGTKVFLYVSTGPEISSAATATIPYVAGMTEEAAIKTLETLGFVVNVIDRPNNDKVAAGVVISQTVKAGEVVSYGSPVNIVVSAGPVEETTTAVSPTQIETTTAESSER